MIRNLSLLAAVLVIGAAGCSRSARFAPLSSTDSSAVVQDNVAHRDTMDRFFREDPASPFRRDSTITYTGLHWFPVDVRFRVQAVLERYASPETVVVMGTRGEQRRHLRYGFFQFVLPDERGDPRSLRLNVYKFTPYDATRYALFRNHLSVWFTDKTTGIETYPVGRYVDIGSEDPDPAHRYTIDFNMAYNPYCAYSALYSCAIPREEDHLDVPVRAGELRYHE